MRLTRIGFLGALVVLACAASAMAGTTTYMGSLTYTPGSDDTVLAFGAPSGDTWSESDFTIAWTVTDVGTPLVNGNTSWQYTYTLTTGSTKAFSNVLISTSPGFSLASYAPVPGGVGTPELAPTADFPDTMQGHPDYSMWLKFNTDNFGNDETTVVISFYSDHMPVWGSFFADDGKTNVDTIPYDNYAYNRDFCGLYEDFGGVVSGDPPVDIHGDPVPTLSAPTGLARRRLSSPSR